MVTINIPIVIDYRMHYIAREYIFFKMDYSDAYYDITVHYRHYVISVIDA